MSLNWDFTGVPNHEEIDPVVKEHMIFGCLHVGMNDITEANAEEFFARINLVETLHGALRRDGDFKFVFTTPEEVQRCIGLRTNVSNETWAKWRNRLVADFMRAARTTYKRETYKEVETS